MDNHYRIMGSYRGNAEEIDETNTPQKAKYLQREYQLAFGNDWSVWVEVQTFDESGTLDECYTLGEV